MKILLVHWNEAELQSRLEDLNASGFDASGHWEQGAKFDSDHMPDALVISLDRLPSHGLAIAEWFAESKKRQGVSVWLVGGDEDRQRRGIERCPGAQLTQWSTLANDLKQARTQS